MKKTPTVYDVAAHSGVSIATVSRVFRRPEDVRASTRALVLASVRDLGYVPSASARGLAARRTGALGLYFPDFDAVDEVEDTEFVHSEAVGVVVDIPDSGDPRPLNLYFDEVLRGSELEAWRNGFALTVGVGRGADPATMMGEMAGRVDGLVVMAQSAPDDVLIHVARRIPIVLMAGPRRDDDFDHVSVANAEGMRALAGHLIDDLDVRDLVYIAGPRNSPDDSERREGFSQALSSRGIDPETVPMLHGDFSRLAGRTLAKELVATDAVPRAIMCSNDQTALGVIDFLTSQDIRIPEDVIVTGFDGIEEGRMSSPRLTTVRQPMTGLGRAAVQVMRSRLANPEQKPITLRLPVKLLLRESSEGVISSAI